MESLNGWQRLWVVFKVSLAIAAGLYSIEFFGEIASRDSKLVDSMGAVLLAGVIAGFLMYGALSALEWVYRGFRPLPGKSAGEVKSSLIEDAEPVKLLRLGEPSVSNSENGSNMRDPAKEEVSR